MACAYMCGLTITLITHTHTHTQINQSKTIIRRSPYFHKTARINALRREVPRNDLDPKNESLSQASMHWFPCRILPTTEKFWPKATSDPVFNISLITFVLVFPTGSMHLSAGHSAMASLRRCPMVGPTARHAGTDQFGTGRYAFLRMGLKGLPMQSAEYRG